MSAIRELDLLKYSIFQVVWRPLQAVEDAAVLRTWHTLSTPARVSTNSVHSFCAVLIGLHVVFFAVKIIIKPSQPLDGLIVIGSMSVILFRQSNNTIGLLPHHITYSCCQACGSGPTDLLVPPPRFRTRDPVSSFKTGGRPLIV